MSESQAATELDVLAQEVHSCTRCDLHLTANRGVPGEGPSDANIMLVGEAPGFNEDKQGRPFVGAAGRFLDELLALAGLKRSEVFITNVVKHRPPENRNPLPEELLACRPYLERQIAHIDPGLIVTLGRFSLGTFFPGDMISKVHGQVREKDGRYFFHMYHPAAALHQDRLKQTLIDDMKKLGEFIGGPFEQRTVRAEASQTLRGEDEPVNQAGESGEMPPEQLTLF